ncbi:MAG: hypothetical protein Q7T83_02925 [Thermodesulfovibrionales bacterium]|nr:hypothetical protein [Thermodesulfovibrionales bacterium]
MWNRLILSFLSVVVMLFGSNFVTDSFGQTPVFGPEKYVRETGKPQKITKTFSIQNSEGEFTLNVQNGEGKRGRVSSAVIEINGIQVVGPNEFNKQVDLITKPVILKQQNEISIEVRSEPGTWIIVTVLGAGAPPPSPVSGITVKPDGFPVNTPTQVTFTAAVPYQPGGSVPTVELERLSQDGNVIAIEGMMVDNGQLSLGDEIQGDGVFSFRKTYSISQPGEIRLRVKVTVGGQPFYSEIFALTAFTPISGTEVDAINNAQSSAEQLYYQLLPAKGKAQALADVVAFLKNYSFVADAGISAGQNSIWIKYTNGMGGGISFNPPGTKGSSTQDSTSSTSSSLALASAAAQAANSEVGNKKVLVLAPFLDEFGTQDDGPATKAIYQNHNAASNCPLYEITYLENVQVGVEAFKTLGNYGIVHVSAHGTTNNNRVVVYTKTSNSAQNLQAYQVDIQAGRLTIETINGRTWLAVTPAFFTYYINSMPSSLVFFSSCVSTFNNSMANALLAKGAKTFLGFDNYVPVPFAYTKVTYFHQAWVEDPTTLVTTGEVFNNGCSGGACWNLLGANDLEAPSGKLQDGGFESGALGIWTASGDGRVLTQLGQFGPVEGSYLGLISTGLGYTVASGSIEQKVCLPPDAQRLEFNWNFNSAEFREWCGSIFQDYFRVDAVTATGSQNLFYRKVDDLCNSVFYTSLCFDLCDVWSTGWQLQSIDISGIAVANQNKPVTIRFSAGDVGDSIYDSAILLDNIKITKP